jgi:antitoxin (DNA-binding transcriptional repressor) of toxin-antitoxin stability system
MKEMSVGEFKKDFSAVLERVRQGEPIAVTYGRKKEVVAVLSPPGSKPPKGARRLGRYAGRVRARFSRDWEIAEEEFLES